MEEAGKRKKLSARTPPTPLSRYKQIYPGELPYKNEEGAYCVDYFRLAMMLKSKMTNIRKALVSLRVLSKKNMTETFNL